MEMDLMSELTWRRSDSGNWVALDVDLDVVYSAGRNRSETSGRQWYLESWPVTDPTTVQRRTGFYKLAYAKHAAGSTHCLRCERFVPFGSVRATEPVRRNSYQTWICRGEEECVAVQAANTARREAEEAEALKHRDHESIRVEDGRFGLELVFTDYNGNSHRIAVTEADMGVLEYISVKHRQRRATELIEKRQADGNAS
jgi:hypothetical protein